jgi:mRNA interferase RelE/StbE
MNKHGKPLGWTIEYDPGAVRDLKKLDRSVRAEIYKYMQERIAPAESPRDFGKPVRHDKFGLWRYRVRNLVRSSAFVAT